MKKPETQSALDKDLDRIGYIEDAAGTAARRLVAPGLSFVFIMICALVAWQFVGGGVSGSMLIAAAALGAYMALNIGANDVANNMGPAVGARALSLASALAIAAVCETLGALLAGREVVGTISSGIIHPQDLASPNDFMLVMLSALVAAGVWVNLATWVGAPVSTTQAIVGAVAGAGAAAAGIAAINWTTLGGIAISWVTSPFLGGILAAVFLAFVRNVTIYQPDKIAASRFWVPILIAVMAGVFTTYIVMKALPVAGLKLPGGIVAGLGVAAISWLLARPYVRRQARGMENRNQSVRRLFSLPLVCAAALMSFAHGANDVANAVGPVAAIAGVISSGHLVNEVHIPFWVMIIGALGISLGLVLFGPRLIHLVGQQITKLNPMRAYCVALATAVTVILASALGLPVSTTHVAVGGVFGVGFFREWETQRVGTRLSVMADGSGKTKRLRPIKNREEQKRRFLVRRAHVMTILAAWVVTVPAAALLGAGVLVVLSFLLG